MLNAGQPSANCTKQSQGEPAKTLRTTNSRAQSRLRRYGAVRLKPPPRASGGWQILRGPALRGLHEDEQQPAAKVSDSSSAVEPPFRRCWVRAGPNAVQRVALIDRPPPVLPNSLCGGTASAPAGPGELPSLELAGEPGTNAAPPQSAFVQLKRSVPATVCLRGGDLVDIRDHRRSLAGQDGGGRRGCGFRDHIRHRLSGSDSSPSWRTSAASKGLSRPFAGWCTIEPSWPLFIAESMSRPRASDLTDDDSRRPHAQGFFDEAADRERPERPRCWQAGLERDAVGDIDSRWSSPVSSMVTRRSSPTAMDAPSAFRHVFCRTLAAGDQHVQPDWTAASRNVAASGLSVPSATRSSSVLARRRNFRTVTWVQRDVNGGMTALRREPSGRRASTSGLVSSSRRPRRPTARRTIRSNSASSSKNTS